MGLKEDVEKFKSGIKRDVVKAKRLAARIALKKLLNRSPARTGSYMSSHNIGISKSKTGRGIGQKFTSISPDFTGAQIQENIGFMPRMLGPAKLALAASLYAKKNTRISTAQLGDTITIYNVIPYADKVEYLGWKKTPAYHVYGLTVAELELIMPLIPKMLSGDISAGVGIV
jgi:hypothetical protein